MPPLFTSFSLASSFWYSGQDWVATPCHSAMADSSIVTLGPGRSLLVDSSVYDSRMAETSKEQFFMDLHADESEGKWTALHLHQPYINWHFHRVDRFTEHKHNKRGFFLSLYFVYFHRGSPLPVVFCNSFLFFPSDVLPKVETRLVLVGEAGNIAELEKALQVPKKRVEFI